MMLLYTPISRIEIPRMLEMKLNTWNKMVSPYIPFVASHTSNKSHLSQTLEPPTLKFRFCFQSLDIADASYL